MTAVFWRTRRDGEFSAELDAHLQSHVEDHIREGMTSSEARRQALIALGGIVKTTPTVALAEPSPVPKMYVPMSATQDVWPAIDVMTYVVRTSTPALLLTASVRDAVKSVDPSLALAQVRTLQDHLDAAATPARIHDDSDRDRRLDSPAAWAHRDLRVMSYIVSQRTSEIGVRLALGAQPSHVIRLIVHQGGGVTVGGIAAGLVVSLAGGRAISSLLYDVGPRDPQVLAATTVALLVVSLVACWLPTRRAASVDPLIALRAE